MKIAVIGAGYVGLVTGISLAAGGRHEITLVERSRERLDELLHGRMPIEEPRLADALRTLSPDERDVLLLFAWADLAYAEIAAVLELPVGTVRSRLHRARAHVRAALDREEALDG